MPELELALRDLGTSLDWPAEPDLEQRVLRRTREVPARRRPRPAANARRSRSPSWPWPCGAAFAVPQTRAAILEFFHLRGVTIERVDELPTVPVQSGSAPSWASPSTLDAGTRARRLRRRRARGARRRPTRSTSKTVHRPAAWSRSSTGRADDPRALFTQFARRGGRGHLQEDRLRHEDRARYGRRPARLLARRARISSRTSTGTATCSPSRSGSPETCSSGSAAPARCASKPISPRRKRSGSPRRWAERPSSGWGLQITLQGDNRCGLAAELKGTMTAAELQDLDIDTEAERVLLLA